MPHVRQWQLSRRMVRHTPCMGSRSMITSVELSVQNSSPIVPSRVALSASNACPILTLLRASPWPLDVSDIARTLDVDDVTAAEALRLLIQAGKARLAGCRWVIV